MFENFPDFLKLIIDFGLVVLIWMVQLLIYPSFLYYPKEDLIKWHKKYTANITYIVAPLMLMQIFIAIYLLIATFNFKNGIYFSLVGATWISTFIQFVPRHHKISIGNFNKKLLIDLVKKNWIRTTLWSSIFAWTLFYYLKF